MGPFNVIFNIILLYSHFLFVNVCDVTHTKQPTAGYRCAASSNTELTLWKTDRHQCVLKCLQLKTCHYINHNYGISRCDLGSDKCESFAPVDDVTVSVFGPPRDTCVRWGSRQEHERVPVQLKYLGYLKFFGTNKKRWYFACWKVPLRMGWPILGQQRRRESQTNARNYGGVEGPPHIFFRHHAISYGWHSNSSVGDSNYCYVIRRTY